MKLIKKLSALIAAVGILGSTALAADIKFDDKITIAPSDTQVTVKLTATADGTINDYNCICINYDTDVYNLNSATLPLGEDKTEFADYAADGQVEWAVQGSPIEVKANDVLISMVFDIVDGSADGTEFSISFDDSDITSDFNIDGTAPVVVEVKSADPVPGTVGTKDGYTTVVDSDKATRFVVTDTKASIAATAASVLKVTYDGDSKSANLYNLLGVDPEATGDVTIGSLTIKMVLPAGVQDAADIADYSFIVE